MPQRGHAIVNLVFPPHMHTLEHQCLTEPNNRKGREKGDCPDDGVLLDGAHICATKARPKTRSEEKEERTHAN